MVDINADGWLDIYVCNSGDVGGDNKQNELFINQQDGTFKEMAADYGIDDKGYSTHAAFFDYDKDGDLDMYLLNNSYRAISSFNPKINIRNKRDEVGGDKLFRNDGESFTDVSESAGIYGSEIGFGLGVTVGDIDQDGWDDIYISNDFFEKDYIYMNNGDGTFQEDLENQMASISVASMGADMADLNNDGFSEIFVTEMLPSDEKRIKTKTTFENWDKYVSNIENGYYHQFTRNMLHLNNGDQSFTEVGRFAGVEASDWSWGAVLADFDNDGLRDIFVANGINKDLTDQDFINYISNEQTMKKLTEGNKVNFKELIDVIPSEKIPNRLFRNLGDLRFEDMAKDFGLAQNSHSNGSAYGDLDNDGDLDLVVNNVNMPLFVYENKSNNNFIKIQLTGQGNNPFAIGTKVYLHIKDEILYEQFMPTKGFQSSMDYNINFGLGERDKIDSLILLWPNGERSNLGALPINQIHKLKQSELSKTKFSAQKPLAKQLFSNLDYKFPFTHKENEFVDFDRDRLIFHMSTTEGPRTSVGDLNGDGKDDLFICGAKGQASAILIQQSNGQFLATNKALLNEKAESEDRNGILSDIDNDGDLDIYVCSGGNEFPNQSSNIIDRLYLNDGRGQFTLSKERLVSKGFIQSATADFADIDNDGDQDFVLAERIKSFQHGIPCSAFISEQVDGKFKDQSNTKGKALLNKGMYTDIRFADINQDGKQDIISCGKYMPITIAIQNDNGVFIDRTVTYGLEHTKGWWNALEIIDVDNDGDLDIIAANHGTNSRFEASVEKPLCLHINDFDNNGTTDHIMCSYVGDKAYPLALRHDLVQQLPGLKKQFLKYEDYALKTIEDIFTEEQRKQMLTLKVEEMETTLFLNDNGVYKKQSLPSEIQYSPIYAIQTFDFDDDGFLDIVMGGNLYEAKPEIGRYDASKGAFLKGDGKGDFTYVKNSESGFLVDGQIRDLDIIKIKNKVHLVVARNNDNPLLFKIDE
jgi:hypothetical protein